MVKQIKSKRLKITNMVKISFLGGCREIGKSAVMLESEITGETILLDYGTKMSDADNCFPEHVSGKQLKGIVLTHAHIDHSGAIPLFYISGNVPLYCTELTYEITSILLKDMINISEIFLPFDKSEIERMDRFVQYLSYRERRQIGENIFVTLYNSGHIPGSALALIEMDGKFILYTGDLNSAQSQLMESCDTDIPPIDVLIIESTYGTTIHEERSAIEERLIASVNKVITKSGKVLIPAFGVSRSQELLMVLYKNGIPPYPIYLDGLARKVSRVYLQYPSMFRDFKALQFAINNVHMVIQKKRQMERSMLLNYPGVIVAPSGMLKGGTSRIYASKLINDPNSAIYLVSYQADDSPGKVLLAEQKYVKKKLMDESELDESDLSGDSSEIKLDAEVQVEFFDFSSHSGKDKLIEFTKSMNFRGDSKKVYCVHGDEPVIMEFVESLKSEGFDASAPELKDTYTV